MREWWWAAQLMADGHVFHSAEWRCSDCRIRVVDLLADRPRCESPNNDGFFVFVGGPLDGDWRQESTIVVRVPLPFGPPEAVNDAPGNATVEGYATVTYERSRMTRKGLSRYEFRG